MTMNTSRPSQLIYGKYVGTNHPAEVIAWTEDLKNYREQLKNLVERDYRFQGAQPSRDSDEKAVGICLNTTGILSEKNIILIQAAPAVNKEGKPLASGGRPFIQYRFIFTDHLLVSQFNNCKGLLLQKLSKENIPYFNQLPSSDDESWADIDASVFELENGITYEEQAQNFSSQKSLITQALNVILHRQRLLITREESTMHPLKFLDNLLCWLPTTYRRKLSIAMGSIDERYCTWADLIVKTYSLPSRDFASSQLTWLNRSSNQLYPGSSDSFDGIEHKYIKNFISDPIENQWIQASQILQDLDTGEDEDFDPNEPSIDFIFKYPVESQYYEQHKTSLLREYWSNIKDKLPDFIDSLDYTLENSVLDKYFSVLWQVVREKFEDVSYPNFVKSLFKKILNLSPSQFKQIVERDELFLKSLPHLLADGFLKLLDGQEIIEALEKVCRKSLEQQESFEKKCNLLSLCIEYKNIFNSAQKLFELSTSILTPQTSLEDFKRLFVDQIIVYLPSIDVSSFEESSLNSYSKHHQLGIDDALYYLLSLRQEGGLKHLPYLANTLKMNNAEVKKVYQVFIEAWQPNYQQSLPLIISSIEKSVSFIEESLQFDLQLFLKIYKHFNTQENLLIQGFSDLAQQPMSWSVWQNLADVLDKNWKNNPEIIGFLDKILGRCFSFYMLKTWLNLLINSSDSNEHEQSFLKGNTWNSLRAENIQELHQTLISHNYSDLTSKLVIWAIKEQRLELIDRSLLKCIKEIWQNQKSIDQHSWDHLTDKNIMENFDNQYWLELASIKISTQSTLVLPPPQKYLSEQEQKSLRQYALEMISLSNSPTEIDRMLQICQSIGLNPMDILSYVSPKAYNYDIISKYWALPKEACDYMPRLFRNLTQMEYSIETEKDKIKELMNQYLITNISLPSLYKDCLSTRLNYS